MERHRGVAKGTVADTRAQVCVWEALHNSRYQILHARELRWDTSRQGSRSPVTALVVAALPLRRLVHNLAV
jgi:hypothetical protein